MRNNPGGGEFRSCSWSPKALQEEFSFCFILHG